MSSENENDMEEDFGYDELERRYLLTVILTEALESDDLIQKLESIADNLDDDDSAAEDEFYKFEKMIIDQYTEKHGTGTISLLKDDSPECRSINNRLLLCYFIFSSDSGEAVEELVTFSKEIVEQFPSKPKETLELADEQITAYEDELILYFFPDEDEEEEED